MEVNFHLFKNSRRDRAEKQMKTEQNKRPLSFILLYFEKRRENG
jgi:hypothetical protein